jgi:hypothetical protein
MHVELTENEKNELAKDCGYSEERRIDNIKKAIGNSEYDKDKENSIHRKTFKIIIDKMIMGEPLTYDDVTEFMKYYDDIEKIKAEAKKEVDGT